MLVCCLMLTEYMYSKEIMGSESWLSSLWSHSRRSIPRKATPQDNDKEGIGVLAFQVSCLMSKVTNLWHFLRDKEISNLREEIKNSIGIQNLIAEDPDYAMDLVLNEIMYNFRSLASSVGKLGRKCADPLFARFDQFVNDPVGNYPEWLGWDYRIRKMERKVKKMDRFAAVTMQLCHENEVLEELEQTLRRMKANPDLRQGKLLEFQQKVTWQRQEVRYLREMSPWTRTHDYVVRLLARSLLTILKRIVQVFVEEKEKARVDFDHDPPNFLPRNHSISALMQSAIYPSENMFCGISSAPQKIKKNQQQQFDYPHLKANSFAHLVYFDDCMMNGNEGFKCGDSRIKYSQKTEKSRVFSKLLALTGSKHRLLDAPCSTLGHAALALRYANVILLIEKLVSSPHMVDSETRDELYNMLPTTIRSGLRTRLKNLLVYDVSSCEGILEWLCPLAHNTIRWHSERSFERQQHDVGVTNNVLLAQTLHYANRVKAEAVVVELLVGLSQLCRTNGELNKTQPSRCGVGYGFVPKRHVNVV